MVKKLAELPDDLVLIASGEDSAIVSPQTSMIEVVSSEVFQPIDAPELLVLRMLGSSMNRALL